MEQRFFLILLASFSKISTGADWCYQSQVCSSHCKGPEEWLTIKGSLCGGQQQSPINIVTKWTVTDSSLTSFQFIDYKKTFRSEIVNNGHTVQVNLPPGSAISGGSLEATYKAVQFHLHWGKDGGPGSEHTVDGERYPMELHIVHMKSKYNSLTDALKDPTGVAVLGFFYERSSNNNNKYESIITALKSITKTNSSTAISGISLDSLIPSESNMTSYYRYSGSLTTPDCSESVVWTVFENTIPLSIRQLSAFSNLTFGDGKPMTHTYRPVQPLNSRKVFRSGTSMVLVSTELLAMMVSVSITLLWAS